MSANGYEIRVDDGFLKFRKNSVTRVMDPTSAVHTADDEEPDDEPDQMREDLSERLRKIFLWILGGCTPHRFLASPRTAAIRCTNVRRILKLAGFEKSSLAELAKSAGVTRAAFSKTACDFRDAMDSKYLASAGDREAHRETFRRATTAAWEHHRAEKAGE